LEDSPRGMIALQFKDAGGKEREKHFTLQPFSSQNKKEEAFFQRMFPVPKPLFFPCSPFFLYQAFQREPQQHINERKPSSLAVINPHFQVEKRGAGRGLVVLFVPPWWNEGNSSKPHTTSDTTSSYQGQAWGGRRLDDDLQPLSRLLLH